MNRREFVRLAGSGVTAGALAEPLVSAQVAAQPAVRKPTAGQGADESRHAARRLRRDPARHGRVRRQSHLQPPAVAELDDAWSVESLTRLRERVESFGLTLDMVPLPLSSSEISRSESPAILLAKSRIAASRSTTSAR